jgi:hypothetical protein
MEWIYLNKDPELYIVIRNWYEGRLEIGELDGDDKLHGCGKVNYADDNCYWG